MAKKSKTGKSLYERFINYVDSLNMLQYVRTETYVSNGKKLYARSAAIRPYDMMKYSYDIANEAFSNVAENAKRTAFIATVQDEHGAKDVSKLDGMFMKRVVKYMKDVSDEDITPSFVKIKAESVDELDLKLTLAGF